MELVEAEAAQEVQKAFRYKVKRALTQEMRAQEEEGTLDRRPTSSKVQTAFEAMLAEFHGFRVQPTGEQGDGVRQYSELRQTRTKKAVLGGLHGFLCGNSYSFVVDLLDCAAPRERRACMKDLLLAFPGDAMAVLGDSEVEQELGVRRMQMDMDTGIVLYYSGNYGEEQWTAMAQTVNIIMDEKLRRAFGNPIPSVRTIHR